MPIENSATAYSSNIPATNRIVQETPNCSTNSSSDQNSCNAGADDIGSQTNHSSGSNTENPISLTTKFAQLRSNLENPLSADVYNGGTAAAKAAAARNPLTGIGLGEDGVGGWKPIKPKSRRGEKANRIF